MRYPAGQTALRRPSTLAAPPNRPSGAPGELPAPVRGRARA